MNSFMLVNSMVLEHNALITRHKPTTTQKTKIMYAYINGLHDSIPFDSILLIQN